MVQLCGYSQAFVYKINALISFIQLGLKTDSSLLFL